MTNKKGNIGVTTENIFPIIKKFLYSDHEIFLRELVSNAVDASQKLKTLSISGEFKGEADKLKVQVILDEDKKTLTIRDNGILDLAFIIRLVWPKKLRFTLNHIKRMPKQ